MTALLFLIAVVLLSLIGGLVLWWRERAPRSMDAHIRAFERELHALSPETPIAPQVRRRRLTERPPPPSRRGPRPG